MTSRKQSRELKKQAGIQDALANQPARNEGPPTSQTGGTPGRQTGKVTEGQDGAQRDRMGSPRPYEPGELPTGTEDRRTAHHTPRSELGDQPPGGGLEESGGDTRMNAPMPTGGASEKASGLR